MKDDYVPKQIHIFVSSKNKRVEILNREEEKLLLLWVPKKSAIKDILSYVGPSSLFYKYLKPGQLLPIDVDNTEEISSARYWCDDMGEIKDETSRIIFSIKEDEEEVETKNFL